MRRIITTFLILILNLTLQSTLFHLFKVRGIMPNTAVIIIISFSLLRGSFEGSATGFFAGLLQDMFYGTSIGYYALLGLLTGYFFGKFHQNFYRENYVLPILLCALGAFAYESVIYVTGFLARGSLNYFYFFWRLILPETVYTGAVSFFIYRLLFSINDSLELKERHKRKLF